MDDDKPYTIHSDTRITLSPLAIELAGMHGMNKTDMARHLLNQHKLQQAGLAQKEGQS